MKKTKASSTASEPRGESEEFNNFDRLFRTIVSVPKSAVEKAEAEEKRNNQQKREQKRIAK
jgi:hypothetical protein